MRSRSPLKTPSLDDLQGRIPAFDNTRGRVILQQCMQDEFCARGVEKCPAFPSQRIATHNTQVLPQGPSRAFSLRTQNCCSPYLPYQSSTYQHSFCALQFASELWTHFCSCRFAAHRVKPFAHNFPRTFRCRQRKSTSSGNEARLP